MSLVSVIMPVYNGSHFILEALESLVSQRWNDWELIVVDDGSTDSTYALVSAFEDPRIRTIRQKNQGEAGARNTGLDAASGEYLAFLDADDVYLPNALVDLTDYLNTHPDYGVVFSDGYLCDSEMKPLMRLSEIRSGIYTGNILEPLVLTNDIITVPSCTMVRRCVIEQEHSRFDTSLGAQIGTDWDFWIHLARRVQFGYLDKITCKYRVHNTNMTTTGGREKRRADLARGRLKILSSDWFEELSAQTRRQFLYDLLIDLLANKAAQQRAVLESDAVRRLPPHDQAALWRQVGSHHLLARTEPDFAIGCLREAGYAYPGDRKSQYLLKIVKITGTSATSLLLWAWQVKDRVTKQARSIGQRRPKAVPARFHPVGN
jgi:glycosyltransferase involved in cell wall biosynthesis